MSAFYIQQQNDEQNNWNIFSLLHPHQSRIHRQDRFDACGLQYGQTLCGAYTKFDAVVVDAEYTTYLIAQAAL